MLVFAGPEAPHWVRKIPCPFSSPFSGLNYGCHLRSTRDAQPVLSTPHMLTQSPREAVTAGLPIPQTVKLKFREAVCSRAKTLAQSRYEGQDGLLPLPRAYGSVCIPTQPFHCCTFDCTTLNTPGAPPPKTPLVEKYSASKNVPTILGSGSHVGSDLVPRLHTWETLFQRYTFALMSQVLGCSPWEAVVGKPSILLPDHQGFGQALGSLFIVFYSDLQRGDMQERVCPHASA